MNRTDTLAYQAAFRGFAETDSWHAPHAVTLTMKQGRQVDGGKGASIQSLTPDEASANLRHFLNRLNQHVYGNAAQRYGKAVPVIPVVEGGNGKRLHYHLVIDCPRDDLREGYVDLLTELWGQTDWGHKKVHVEADCDAGWTKYVSKLRDKPNFADSIDWANYHPCDRRD